MAAVFFQHEACAERAEMRWWTSHQAEDIASYQSENKCALRSEIYTQIRAAPFDSAFCAPRVTYSRILPKMP